MTLAIMTGVNKTLQLRSFLTPVTIQYSWHLLEGSLYFTSSRKMLPTILTAVTKTLQLKSLVTAARLLASSQSCVSLTDKYNPYRCYGTG